MECVGVDILGPFPVTDHCNRYILVAMDYFTKWPEAYAVPDQSTATTAEKLVQEMFCCFGAPEELHSDQGHNFESQVFQEVCQHMGVKKTRATPLHPQSNGLVERFNRTLATQLPSSLIVDRKTGTSICPWSCGRTKPQSRNPHTAHQLPSCWVRSCEPQWTWCLVRHLNQVWRLDLGWTIFHS
ncbi:hypothetical protein LDENG_00060880, partial [Lucifuga dentata]